jgi:hypothetical protein
MSVRVDLSPAAILALSATLASTVAACQAETSDEDVRPALYTLFDLEQALRTGGTIAPNSAFPQGMPATDFLEPRGAEAALRVAPAFSEGAPAAYVATEIWVNFPEIWVQPWYFLVSSYSDRPLQNRLRDAAGMPSPPVFDVSHKSRFYSPFWQLIYAVAPAGASADRYKSAETIFNDRLPLHFGGGWVYSVRPPGVVGDNKLLHPTMGTEIGILSSQPAAWIDGESVPYFNQGGNNFTYDERLVVEDVPLFQFARRDAAGAVTPLNVPRVMGSVPLYSRRPAPMVNGRPGFGAYSRLTMAIVPATAAPFEAATAAAAVEVLKTKMLDPRAYEGRLAMNARGATAMDKGCFDLPEFPQSCLWLDSQARVEELLGPVNLRPTEVTFASALVFFGGKGIGR